MSTCPRCAAGLLPGAIVCHACCAPVGEADLAIADDATIKPQDPLSSWPFGAADAQTELTVSKTPRVRDVMPQLLQYAENVEGPGPDGQWATSLRTTFRIGALPEQRNENGKPKRGPHVESVPSTGPNPFLAAARLQQAHDGGEDLEAYTA